MDVDLDRPLKSLRRSRDRRKVLLVLDRRRSATITEIAIEAGLRWERVHAALVGHGRTYRRDLSLIAVGCVEKVEGTAGTVWHVTRDGSAAALALGRAMSRDTAVQGLSDLVCYFDAVPPRPP